MPRPRKTTTTAADTTIPADTTTTAAIAEQLGVIAARAVRYDEIPPAQVFASPLNPRRQPGGIEALAVSIAHNGLLQPILVRSANAVDQADRYEIILGARRHAACLAAIAGVTDDEGQSWQLPADYRMPLRVRADTSDDELVILAATENFDREDMSALDEAELFHNLRPRVTPKEGQRREDAVAQLFPKISTRTVFRRLSLLKLAPELQTALRDHALTLGQAEAFALGSHNDQRAHWKQVRNAAAGDWRANPGQIQRTMVRELIPVERAIFDPELYQGDIVEDEDGDKFFADAAEFARLQKAAIETQRAALALKWPWVEILENPSYEAYEWHGVKKSDKEAGAVIAVRGTKVEIVAPVLLKAVVDRRRREKAAAERKTGGSSEESASSPPPLVEGQVRALHAAKTRALRHAVTGHDTAALALACIGLLGEQEVRGLQGAVDWHARHGSDQYESNSHVATVRARLALAAAALLPDGTRPAKGSDLPSFEKSWDKKAADSAAWFRALVALPKPDLLDFFNHLLAERLGSWAGVNAQASSTWLGDSKLAVAIAEVTGAGNLLPNEWAPDRDYFNGYGKERLAALVNTYLGVDNASRLKKGQLVDACVKQVQDVPGFWSPAHFAECRFQSEAEAKGSLVLPLAAAIPDDSTRAINARSDDAGWSAVLPLLEAGGQLRRDPKTKCFYVDRKGSLSLARVKKLAGDGTLKLVAPELSGDDTYVLAAPPAPAASGDPAEIERDVLGRLNAERGTPLNDITVDSGWTVQQVKDALSRLFVRKAVLLDAGNGWRLPRPSQESPDTDEADVADQAPIAVKNGAGEELGTVEAIGRNFRPILPSGVALALCHTRLAAMRALREHATPEAAE